MYVYVRVHVCTHTYTSAYMFIHMHVYIHVCVHCMCVHMQVCIHVCVCTYMPTYMWKLNVKDRCLPELLSSLCLFFTCVGGTHKFKHVWVYMSQSVCLLCAYVCRGQRLARLSYALIWNSHLNPELANRLVWLASLLLRFPVSQPHALALQDSCPTHLGVTWVPGT